MRGALRAHKSLSELQVGGKTRIYLEQRCKAFFDSKLLFLDLTLPLCESMYIYIRTRRLAEFRSASLYDDFARARARGKG